MHTPFVRRINAGPIEQLHQGDYRRAATIGEGALLVLAQIARLCPLIRAISLGRDALKFRVYEIDSESSTRIEHCSMAAIVGQRLGLVLPAAARPAHRGRLL